MRFDCGVTMYRERTACRRAVGVNIDCRADPAMTRSRRAAGRQWQRDRATSPGDSHVAVSAPIGKQVTGLQARRPPNGPMRADDDWSRGCRTPAARRSRRATASVARAPRTSRAELEPAARPERERLRASARRSVHRQRRTSAPATRARRLRRRASSSGPISVISSAAAAADCRRADWPAGGNTIHRARDGHAARLISPAAEILNGRQHARANNGQATPVVMLTLELARRSIGTNRTRVAGPERETARPGQRRMA